MEIGQRTHGPHAAASEGLGCLLGAVRKRHLQLHTCEGWLNKASVVWGIQDAAEDGFKYDLAEGSDGYVPAPLMLSVCVGSTYMPQRPALAAAAAFKTNSRSVSGSRPY